MKHIPDVFMLGGTVWKVIFDDALLNVDEMGSCCTRDNSIYIRPGLPVAVQEHTFYHELVHAICYTIGYKKLNADEDRVDAIGGMIYQFMQTVQYPRKKRAK